MPNFMDIIPRTQALSQHVQQIINALKGKTGAGVPILLTALNDALRYSLTVRNLAGLHFRVMSQNALNTVPKFEVKEAGVYSDGSFIPNVDNVATFNNKRVNFLDFSVATTPAPPAAGFKRVYVRSDDGNVYAIDSTGVVTQVSGETGGGGGGGGTVTIAESRMVGLMLAGA